MLVVVEDRDLHLLLEPVFDLEARRSGDVFEVDAAEGRLHQLDRPDELFRVVGVELEIEDVDVGESLEENRLPFHHRLARARTDISEPEDGGAVGDDGDKVAAIRVLVDVAGILGDLETRLGDARRVRQRQIALRRRRFGGNDLSFPGPAGGMIFESFVADVIHHGGGLYRPTESRKSDSICPARP